jgi:hypothetical protein
MKSFIAAAALSLISTAVFAGQPANPGGFGTYRADSIENNYRSGGAYDTAPGGSEWGALAGVRGADNGAINREFKGYIGGEPTSNSNSSDAAGSNRSSNGHGNQ